MVRSLYVVAVLAVVGLLVAGNGLIAQAKPIGGVQGGASFDGKWTGPWTNSLGERGKSELNLTEVTGGVLVGTWDGVEVAGRRVNRTTFELHGETKTRSYQMTGTVEKGTLMLKYLVTRLGGMDGSYEGRCLLNPRP
ncbi:MAG: hypothetical protein U0800_00950 [Isosphaeraceae bacterium]